MTRPQEYQKERRVVAVLSHTQAHAQLLDLSFATGERNWVSVSRSGVSVAAVRVLVVVGAMAVVAGLMIGDRRRALIVYGDYVWLVAPVLAVLINFRGVGVAEQRASRALLPGVRRRWW